MFPGGDTILKKGLIQVYTGDGKGKTTAAVGLAVRAWGRGLKVRIFQMLKAPGSSGEHWAVVVFQPSLPIYPLGTGEFIVNRRPTAVEIEKALAGWMQIQETIAAGGIDLLVIDELSHAINVGLLGLEMVLVTLRQKPPELELVLTGRDMPAEILEMADLVTEMKAVKHPYNSGLEARSGIDY